MLVCKQCDKANTLDGKFCRGCGHALNEQELAAAITANHELISEGFKLLAEHRFEEALLVADTAIETDPSATQAIALRGDCLERMGDLKGALIAFEQVVAANPDSTLDRIKLTHLKNVMAERSVAPAPTNRRSALLAGVAATILVASLGSAAALLNQGSNKKDATPVESNSPLNSGSVAMTDVPNPADQRTPTNPNPEQKPNVASTPNTATEPRNEESAARPVQPAGSGSALPNARPNGGRVPMEGELPPLSPNITITPIEPERPSSPRPSVDPDPAPQANPSGGTTTAQSPNNPPTNATRPNAPKPVIDIRPAPNQGGRVGGSDTVPNNSGSANSASDWNKKARELFIQRDFEGAIKAYERALAAGADPGITNQRLAQCHEALGHKAEAIRYYEQAASTYERKVNAGTASASDRNGLEACRQAIKVLRGE